MRAFLTKLVVALVGAGLVASAGAALACNTGCPPPPPPSPPHNPPPPNMPCEVCGGHGGHGGNTNVNVNVNVKSSASASASAFGGASAGATYYGGYGNWSQAQGIPQPAGGLNVITGGGGGMESYEEMRTMTAMMILQASCIDDTGVPHPASQLNGDRDIDNRYAGEIYRCIAGTHMQVLMIRCGGSIGGGGEDADFRESDSETYSHSESASSYASGMMGDGAMSSHSEGGYAMGHDDHGGYHGGHDGQGGGECHGMDFDHISFDGGQTMSCQKGEALWFERGALTCRVQIQQRQCNERSLLRRFGAGIKVLTVTRTEKVTKQREIARSASASWGSAVMTFDGGVGGFVQ